MFNRLHSFSSANALWEEVINEENLKVSYNDINPNNYLTRECYLSNERTTVSGAGKGPCTSTIHTSANFESLEYYLSGIHHKDYQHIRATVAEIKKQYEILPFRFDYNNFINSMKDDTQLPWAIYTDITSNKNFAIPLAAVDLTYFSNNFEYDSTSYSQYDFYSASNGLSSGSSYEEAVTHGLLEVIERDAYSYFIIDTFYLNKPILTVSYDSLPESCKSVVTDIEKAYQDKLLICKLPSRFGVEVYCTTFQNNDFYMRPRGFGASLDAKIALERSIYEALQSYNLMTVDLVHYRPDLKVIDTYKLIRESIQFELISRPYEKIQFTDSADDYTEMELEEYMHIIINRVKEKSNILVNIPYKHNNGLHCVRTIMPNASEFFLITHTLLMPVCDNLAHHIKQYGEQDLMW